MASALLAARLSALGLAGPHAASVGEVLERAFAVQAQDVHAARWALGVRCTSASVETVDAAFNDGTVVRTWAMRGTWFAVAAHDAGWLIGLLGARNLRRVTARHRELKLSPRDFDRARTLVERTLPGRSLSREELHAVFAKGKLAPEGQRGVHLTWVLAQWGVLVQGPMIDGEPHFVLHDDWVKRPRTLKGDEALAELAARYVEGHGPVSLADFAFWSGLPQAEAQRALDAAGRRVRFALSGWVSSRTRRSAAVPEALLLPGFDEHLLGYRDRDWVLDAAHAARVVPGGNGVFRPTVVLDGRVAGTWARTVRARDVTLGLTLFRDLTTRQRRALELAGARFARFLGREVDWAP